VSENSLVQSTDRPATLAILRKNDMISKAACESSPLVGSSKNRIDSGRAASSTPIVTRFRSSIPRPPISELPMMAYVVRATSMGELTSARGVRSRSCITSSTYDSFSWRETDLSCRIKAENSRHSRTLRALALLGPLDSRCVAVVYICLHAEASTTAEGTVEGLGADRKCSFDESRRLPLGDDVKQRSLSCTRLEISQPGD
jgi:hypothetical protein